jgi:hypothetical protein
MKTSNNFKLALLIEGLILAGMGSYFIFLRPALLPEDFNYIGINPIEMSKHVPGITRWLNKVFSVLGGYITATGLLIANLGFLKDQRRSTLSFFFLLFAGSSSIGLMTVVNFMIDSDFKWLLLSFTLPWIFSLLTFYRPMNQVSPQNRLSNE